MILFWGVVRDPYLEDPTEWSLDQGCVVWLAEGDGTKLGLGFRAIHRSALGHFLKNTSPSFLLDC